VPSLLLESLAPSKQSLEELYVIDDYEIRDSLVLWLNHSFWENSASLNDFQKLKRLTISNYILLGKVGIGWSTDVDRDPVRYAEECDRLERPLEGENGFLEALPRSLEYLKLVHCNIYLIYHYVKALIDRSHSYTPKLNQLAVEFSYIKSRPTPYQFPCWNELIQKCGFCDFDKLCFDPRQPEVLCAGEVLVWRTLEIIFTIGRE
jgi:hypothetical protein